MSRFERIFCGLGVDVKSLQVPAQSCTMLHREIPSVRSPGLTFFSRNGAGSGATRLEVQDVKPEKEFSTPLCFIGSQGRAPAI